MDCSPPGSSVHGILQARILEWVSMSSSRGASQPRGGGSLPLAPPGSPYDPTIPLLGIYPEKTITERDVCTPVFVAALFTIARTCKQLRYPLTDGCIKKLWYIYLIEYYSVIQKNTFESVLMRWMNLKHVTQSEVSQKNQYHILMHIYGI